MIHYVFNIRVGFIRPLYFLVFLSSSMNQTFTSVISIFFHHYHGTCIPILMRAGFVKTCNRNLYFPICRGTMNCALSVFILFSFTMGTMHRAPTSLNPNFLNEIRDTNLTPEFYLLTSIFLTRYDILFSLFYNIHNQFF